jgi:chromate transporter
MSSPTAQSDLSRATPSLLDLFRGFSGIAMMGFGGVLPWARRMVVEQRGWLTEAEFAETLSLAQFSPGGNILNLAVLVGRRYHGAAGAIVSAAGLIAAPMVIVSTLGLLYIRYGEIEPVQHALAGVAAGAAGLILSMAYKMAQPLFRKDGAREIAVAAVAFLAVGLLQVSLPLVLVVLAPLSIALAWWRLR